MLTKPTLKGIPLVTYEMVYDFMHLFDCHDHKLCCFEYCVLQDYLITELLFVLSHYMGWWVQRVPTTPKTASHEECIDKSFFFPFCIN